MRFCRSLLLFFLSAFLSITAHAQYSHMIVFGDSLTDDGNVHAAPFTNPGATFQKMNWALDVMQNLFPGQTLYPSSQLPKGQTPTALSIDYAWGGAISGEMLGVPTAMQQVNQYLSDSNNLVDPNALFIVWIGGNDLLDMLHKIPHTSALTLTDIRGIEKSILASNPAAPVDKIDRIVNTLLSSGVPANHLYVINLPDLSNTPEAQAVAKGRESVLNAISLITQIFDTNLQASLSKVLPPGHYIDLGPLTQIINTQPNKYAFTDLHDSCVSKHQLPLCKGYVYYDSIHPTQKTHQLIADVVLADVTARAH